LKCSIKRRNLPPAPKPTRPIIVKEVQGINHHLEGRPEKPAVVPGAKKKRRTPSEAIAESARKKSEAKRQRKAEAIRLWESGMTIKEIAEHMGLKCGAICDYTRDVRTLREQGERYKYDKEIIKLYNDGYTYNEIAECLGITRSNVNDKLNRLRKDGKIVRRIAEWTRIKH
jgi:DNA-binding CsgD family transcriptional regulator